MPRYFVERVYDTPTGRVEIYKDDKEGNWCKYEDVESLNKSYDNLVESYRTIFEENSKFNVLLEAARAFTNISNDEYTDELYDKLVEAVKLLKDK